MNEDVTANFGGFSTIENKKFRCPKHGIVEEYINVNIPGYDINGNYCLICWCENLKKNICKLEAINE